MEEAKLYRLVIDAVKDPLVLAGANGVVLMSNTAAEAFFDLEQSHNVSELKCAEPGVDVDGAAIRDLMSRHESVRDYALAANSGITVDIETVHADGDKHKLLHFRSPSEGRHREFWRDDMISMVSHEIKNPLSAMKQSVDILLSGVPGELTDGQRRFLGTSGRSIDRLTHLVEGFLDVSRIHSGAFRVKRERVDVEKLVADTLGSFKTLFNVRHVSIDWRVDDTVRDAWLDTGLFEQVMVNLLSNALKHTPEGGEIRVGVETAGIEALEDDFRLLPWNDLGAPRLVVVRVEDNGIGMSTETLDNVFERYHGAPGDGRGTHLGLSISKKLVEAQGGSLDVDSTLGLGTTVALRLPQDAATSCRLTRIARAREALARLERDRHEATMYVLGKLDDVDWDDICPTWGVIPAVNPEPGTVNESPLELWTLSSALALAIVAKRDEKTAVDEVFTGRFVECEHGALVFNGYAVGSCRAPDEGRGFGRLFGVAMQRMLRARGVMEQSMEDRRESDMDFVLNEWKVTN